MAKSPCQDCGYDLAGLTAGREGMLCPECGKRSPTAACLRRLRRIWAIPAIGAAALWLVLAIWTYPKAKQNNWAVVGAVIVLVPAAGILNTVLTLIVRGKWARGTLSRNIGISSAVGIVTAFGAAVVALIIGELADGSGC